MPTLLSEERVRELSLGFEEAAPREIVRWALEDAGLERVAVASAFQAEGTAVIHMAASVRPDVPILFLETGFHFAETLAFKERLTELLGLNVVDLTGDFTVDAQAEAFGPRLYERDPHLCCELNKVEPWRRALDGLDLWITSMRRDSAWTRRDTPIVSLAEAPSGRRVLKVNPIANWTRRDAWTYLREHDLPHNPLYELGYASIGCAPCTRAIQPGEDERAGRWSGSNKVECGIHVPESGQQEAVIRVGGASPQPQPRP